MKFFVDIHKIEKIKENTALYKAYAYYSKKYHFYVSINLKTKIVSFFDDKQQKIILGDYNLNFPDTKIDIKGIPNEVSLLVCKAAKVEIENQQLSDDISRAVG